MKRILLALLTVLTYAVPSWADVEINETNFPDATFRDYVGKKSNKIDKDGNGTLTDEEIASVTSLAVNGKKIASLKGVEFFTALTELKCHNNQLTSLDLSKNTALTTLWCYQNQIRGDEMNALIASLPSVTGGTLRITYSQEKSESNLCTTTNVEAAKAKGWSVYNSTGTEFAGLVILCTINETSFPDETFRTYVASTSVDGNQDGILTETEATKLTKIDMSGKGVTSLKGIEYFTAITTLYCYTNQLTSLDVSKNTALKTFYFYGNQIKSAAMEALIASLPTVSSGTIRVINVDDENEGNVCTESQVSAMKEKGWSSVKYCVGNSWQDYTGVLPIKIDETNFPDANFRAFVASSSVDTNTDGMLTTKELGITTLDVSGKEITNLKGIEYFTAIWYLDCHDNQLTSIDVSKNTALTYLDCQANQLTSLDISSYTALRTLKCSDNRLSSLDVSNNIALTSLECYNNKLTSLTISQESQSLTTIHCYGNQIKGEAMTALIASLPSNDKTTTKRIYILDLSNKNEANECTTAMVESLNNSKWTPYYRTATSWTVYTGVLPLEISAEIFPDANFRAYISSNSIDIDQDGRLSTWELSTNMINISGLGVSDITGIELFTNLTYLYCSNNNLTSLNTNVIKNLKTLDCSNNNLTSLNVNNITYLDNLNCSNNKLTSLDVYNNTYITTLNCSGNSLEVNDLSGCRSLKTLDCSNNKFTGLDASNTSLTTLYCQNNQIHKLIVKLPTVDNSTGKIYGYDYTSEQEGNCISTEEIEAAKEKGWTCYIYKGNEWEKLNEGVAWYINDYFSEKVFSDYIKEHFDTNEDGVLTDREARAVTEITIHPYYNPYYNICLTNMDGIGLFPNLKVLDLSGDLQYSHNIGSLDLSHNSALTHVYCDWCNLTTLNVPSTALQYLDCANNQLTELNVSNNVALEYLDCSANQLTELSVSNNIALEHLNCSSNQLTELNVSNCVALEHLECLVNYLTELNLSNNKALSYLNCENNELSSLDISNNLELLYLRCGSWLTESNFTHNHLTTLDVSKNTKLKELRIRNLGLNSLDLSTCPELEYLDIEDNKISGRLDLSNKKALKKVLCSDNSIEELDVSNCQNLEYLSCKEQDILIKEEGTLKRTLTSLNLTNCTSLTSLDCRSNNLSTLDISTNKALDHVWCSSNLITNLVVSNYPSLTYLECYNNSIKESNMDALIAGLPTNNSGEEYRLLVSNNTEDGLENNKITSQQISDVKSKGWTPYYAATFSLGSYTFKEYGVTADAGDVNGDGNVNAADIVEAVNLIKTGGYDKAADLNNDGKVDSTDVDAITKIIMTTK